MLHQPAMCNNEKIDSEANFFCEFGKIFQNIFFTPVDTRRRFNVDTTSYRRWNGVVCLQGQKISGDCSWRKGNFSGSIGAFFKVYENIRPNKVPKEFLLNISHNLLRNVRGEVCFG